MNNLTPLDDSDTISEEEQADVIKAAGAFREEMVNGEPPFRKAVILAMLEAVFRQPELPAGE